MRFIGVIWGLIGVSALLIKGILSVTPRAIDALKGDLTWLQWSILIVFAFFMLFAEGYRGFQKKMAPRTAARIRYLKNNPTWVRVLFAPFFCMGYFGSNKKTQITSICVTLGIALLVICLAAFVSDIWRGIIGVGVALGLTWGIIAFWIFTYQALTQKEFKHSPQTPGS